MVVRPEWLAEPFPRAPQPAANRAPARKIRGNESHAQMTLPPYVIVSPVRDEAEFLGRTIASIVAQEHRPVEWVIVDDGSTDATPAIAAAAARDHDWIHVV